MKLFRIASRRHKIFSGVGAAKEGGRWNSRGNTVIYAATSLAGAKLELLAHAGGFNELPVNYGYVIIDVPDAVSVARFPSSKVPPLRVSISWGDKWLTDGNSLIALVPSKASPGDWNALINPMHPDFVKLKVSAELQAKWDSRHFKRSKNT
jgi:RES domain-containing protein